MYILDHITQSITGYLYDGELNIVTSYADMTNTSYTQGIFTGTMY